MTRKPIDLVQCSPDSSDASFLKGNELANFVLWYEILGLRLPEIAAEYGIEEAKLRELFNSYLSQRQTIVETWLDKNASFIQVSRLRAA